MPARPRAELEDEVLSSMAQLDIGPLPEEAVLPLLERLAPPTLDDAVAARAEAASAAQARLPHIDMLEVCMGRQALHRPWLLCGVVAVC
jgi:hypothetical protein